MELITRRDLPPFEAAIAAGVRAVMPGHLRVPGLTGDLPASLSAVGDGRLPGARLEEAAASVAGLRAWTLAHRQQPAPADGNGVGRSPAGHDGAGQAGHDGVGLAAARRAIRADGIAGPVHDPLVVEVVPPANMAVGSVPWGLRA